MESRRSHPNLSYLTLSPISTRLPVDTSPNDDPEVPTPWAHRTSYISGKSAPTTPRILSRSPSQTRLDKYTSNKLASSKSHTHLAGRDIAGPLSEGDLARSRSTGAGLAGLGARRKKKSHRASESSDAGEWLFRTGTGITSEARESKGQSWLVSRESSTSLVAQGGEDEDDEIPQYPLITPRSARPSRGPSRMTSAKPSRRGSKVGSRADLTFFATPGARTPGTEQRLTELRDYFGNADPSALAGPDFVDDEDLEEEDDSDVEEQKRQEDEVRKLTSDERAGIGGLIDRLFDWSLAGDEEESNDEKRTVQQDVAKKAKAQTARVEGKSTKPSTTVSREAPGQTSTSESASSYRKNVESQGWSDAAWLLSVASKVLL